MFSHLETSFCCWWEVQWKDRSADGPISAKKPRKVKERQKEEMKKREDEKATSESHGSEEGSDE